MRKSTKRKQRGAFHQNLEKMTLQQIESMSILDSEKHIRFLQDPETGFYVVFNGRFNQTHYSTSYQAAERFFNKLVSISWHSKAPQTLGCFFHFQQLMPIVPTMKTTYTNQQLVSYLKHFRYLPTYRKSNKDAFYNPRNRQDLLVPIDKESFTQPEIIALFQKSRATDFPPEIEWSRFHLFHYSQQV